MQMERHTMCRDRTPDTTQIPLHQSSHYPNKNVNRICLGNRRAQFKFHKEKETSKNGEKQSERET